MFKLVKEGAYVCVQSATSSGMDLYYWKNFKEIILIKANCRSKDFLSCDFVYGRKLNTDCTDNKINLFISKSNISFSGYREDNFVIKICCADSKKEYLIIPPSCSNLDAKIIGKDYFCEYNNFRIIKISVSDHYVYLLSDTGILYALKNFTTNTKYEEKNIIKIPNQKKVINMEIAYDKLIVLTIDNDIFLINCSPYSYCYHHAMKIDFFDNLKTVDIASGK